MTYVSYPEIKGGRTEMPLNRTVINSTLEKLKTAWELKGKNWGKED